MTQQVEKAYSWAEGSGGIRISVDPQVVGEAIEVLGGVSGARVDDILEAARDPESVLHDVADFKWDDDREAAHEYRRNLVRKVVNSIRVKVIIAGEPKKPVSGFVSVSQPGGERAYQPILHALSSPSRDQVLERAERELQSWLTKYENLAELDSVLTAIRGFLTR
jgi:hypothetical protein